VKLSLGAIRGIQIITLAVLRRRDRGSEQTIG